MALLSDSDRARVRDALSVMTSPVVLQFYTKTLDCETCADTRQILDELVPLSDKLSIEEHDFILEKEASAAAAIDRVPVVALSAGGGPARVRFFGIPAGYEFSSLIDAVVAVSTGQSRLSDESRALVAKVTGPTDIQVFVTPT